MTSDSGIWRWNVNPVWHHHSSMVQEAVLATEATDDFTKYHHLRGCFYFGIGALEAFLNEQMRFKLTEEGMSENKIFKELRYTNLQAKREEWPSIICGNDVEFPKEYSETISEFNALRGEITHPKAKDHAIYKNLDEADPSSLVEAISCSLVHIYHIQERPFPYWLLGWNYVGMNGNVAYPALLNNQNGFIWSLEYMGFKVSAGQGWIWEKKYMTSVTGYNQIKASLDAYPDDMEPFQVVFGPKPRLTKRWWDRQYIIENTPEEFRT